MKYAIVESGGKQYRAVEGGVLEVDRLPVEAGVNLKLDQVLLLADGEQITVGTPLVKDSPIWVKVVEHFKGEKVTIFNYSPKKRIRVKTGHRQNYTRLRVEQIGGTEPVKKAEVTAPKAEKPVKAGPPAEKKPAEKPVKKPAEKTEKKAAPKPAAAASKAKQTGAKPKAAAPKGKTTAKKSESK
jgi:large subunit ribosomal protein L21